MILQTEQLSKRFKNNTVVNHVTLHVEKGEIYGFLGPNGAGKTTIMAMLLGLLPPTKGDIRLFGIPFGGDDPEIRRRIGVVQEKPYLYPEMTAIEYLKCFADLYGVNNPVARLHELLEKLELSHAAGKRIGTFSRGMQQRVSIARALLHEPELLLLDEPVSGLDPHGIRKVRDLLIEVRQNGATVFLSSHILSEAEKLCDRVGIIHQGNLLAEESIRNLGLKLAERPSIEVDVKDLQPHIVDALKQVDVVQEIVRVNNHLSLHVEAVDDAMEIVSRTISQAGATLLSLSKKEPTLEEAFLTITAQNISLLSGSESEQ